MARTQNIGDSSSEGVLSRNQTTLISNTEIFSKSEWTELVDELSLSPRQTEVVQHLFSSQSDKQIAMDLQIAVPTVRTHLSRLFSKFDVQDRSELILYIFRQFRRGCQPDERPRSQ